MFELDLSYSELTSNEIQNLVINSRLSTFEDGTAESISQDSLYDTNRLGDLNSVKTIDQILWLRYSPSPVKNTREV